MTLSKEEIDATLLLQDQIRNHKEWIFMIKMDSLSLNYSNDGIISQGLSLASIESNISLNPSIDIGEVASHLNAVEHGFTYYETFLHRPHLRLNLPAQFISSLKNSLESKSFTSCKLHIEPSEKNIGPHRLRFKGRISFVFDFY